MDTIQGLDETIRNNTVIGAAGMAFTAFLYKMWRIVRADKTADKIDDEEQKFRDMLRSELESAKAKLEILYQENVELKSRLAACEVRLEYAQKLCDRCTPSYREIQREERARAAHGYDSANT